MFPDGLVEYLTVDGSLIKKAYIHSPTNRKCCYLTYILASAPFKSTSSVQITRVTALM